MNQNTNLKHCISQNLKYNFFYSELSPNNIENLEILTRLKSNWSTYSLWLLPYHQFICNHIRLQLG